MDEEKCENKPTYENLLKFYNEQIASREFMRAADKKRALAKAELDANLSKTWTGRLVLLAEELDVDWVAIFAFVALMSLNLWIMTAMIIFYLSGS